MLQMQQEEKKREKFGLMVDRAFEDMILSKMQNDRETHERKDKFRQQLLSGEVTEQFQAFSGYILN